MVMSEAIFASLTGLQHPLSLPSTPVDYNDLDLATIVQVMGGDTKCTFGTRMPIDIHMLNEMIYREVKHFRNYKIYRPNFGSIPVTGKFYAAHDQLKAESKEQIEKVENYHHNVAQTRAKGPHSKYPSPATENQVYGWYDKPLVPMDRDDSRFYHPKRESSHTKIEIVILMCNPRKKT